ncbi:hypothetical protein BDW02DRAFT_525568 [Decorospora gaudefroyi]|uniref:Uncharacterized protein n=1 Tax=Decorospora gaudefroyi TaxID=184978 RepID=A0A6A5KG61_9PLEO|nr:hypothetical protein BDW02DRAFT_525568 [Decorospora gaudefroyi]
MAPPARYGPPAYSIPQRYMHREPPPEGADSNTRPYIIFFSYLLTCFLVTIFILLKLIRRASVLQKSTTARLPPKKHVWLFGGLAVGSLLSTWTQMFQYFRISYHQWLMWRSYYELEPHMRHWGLWLKETSLFREAWETVIVGNARYWWSHQIFFFALGLGLYLEQKGLPRGIRYTWAFMLLGQIVAISFATNLFLLTLLLSPPAPPSAPSGTRGHKWLGPWLLNLLAIFATAYPAMQLADEHYWYHPTHFMPMLLAPHIALMVLPVVRALVPPGYFEDDIQIADRIYNYLWVLVFANGGLMLGWTTVTAYAYSGVAGIVNAVFEHPAVGSVGFDVVFCWTTWICWKRTQTKPTRTEVSMHADEPSTEFVRDGRDTFVGAGAYGDGIRRR